MLGDPFQGPSQKIVVQRLRRDAVEVRQARLLRPGPDAKLCPGLQQAIDDHQLDQLPQGDLSFPGHRLVDDLPKFQLLEKRRYHRQSTDHLHLQSSGTSSHLGPPWQTRCRPPVPKDANIGRSCHDQSCPSSGEIVTYNRGVRNVSPYACRENGRSRTNGDLDLGPSLRV